MVRFNLRGEKEVIEPGPVLVSVRAKSPEMIHRVTFSHQARVTDASTDRLGPRPLRPLSTRQRLFGSARPG